MLPKSSEISGISSKNINVLRNVINANWWPKILMYEKSILPTSMKQVIPEEVEVPFAKVTLENWYFVLILKKYWKSFETILKLFYEILKLSTLKIIFDHFMKHLGKPTQNMWAWYLRFHFIWSFRTRKTHCDTWKELQHFRKQQYILCHKEPQFRKNLTNDLKIFNKIYKFQTVAVITYKKIVIWKFYLNWSPLLIVTLL